MKKTTVRCHLIAEVPDPRKEKGKRHPLPAILALGIVATPYGRSHDQLRESLGFTQRKHLVRQRCTMCLGFNAEVLTAKLTHWATLAFESFRPCEGSLTGVADAASEQQTRCRTGTSVISRQS